MSSEKLACAVFLDRDGTLIAEKKDLADPDRVEFIAGAFEALRALRAAGYRIVVVTNQSGIARGVFSLAEYHAVEARIKQSLADGGIQLDGVYFCPHHPDFGGPCECRKPKLGMYREAARNLGLDLAASIYVGDRLRDVQAGLETGGRSIMVQTGYGAAESGQAPAGVEVVADLAAAAQLILGKTRATP